jgi:hypothetical protein
MKKENKMIPDSEIMKNLLIELRYSALAFSKKLGYKSHSSIDHILKGKNTISDNMRDLIIKFFPDVNYWYLKKGQMPIIIDKKLENNQTESSVFKIGVEKPDYALETFTTLKNIELLLLKINSYLDQKD